MYNIVCENPNLITIDIRYVFIARKSTTKLNINLEINDQFKPHFGKNNGI